MRLLGFALAFLFAISATPASALGFVSLKSFCTGTCTSGQNPVAPLVRDSVSVLYGTASVGGANQEGVVFRLTPFFKVLYNFCNLSACADGSAPLAGLIIDTSGNLYGTTSTDGGYLHGSVFELVKPATPTGTWTLTTLYDFCPTSSCPDGAKPMAKLTYAGAESGTPYDGTSALFGTTQAGGAANVGTVYELRRFSGVWLEKVLLDFGSGKGEQPQTALVMDATTNVLWGTAQGGGSWNSGVAFKLVPGGNLWNNPWTETVIYNFCWAHGSCSDGVGPSNIVRDASGNIYGGAVDGGALGFASAPGPGVVFKLTDGGCSEGGGSTFWCNTVLYNFCSLANCADGLNPALGSELAIDSSGNLFGTTQAGGSANNHGVVYELSGTTETVLHSFCASSGCPDGADPLAGVILDPFGTLFGTTDLGGTGSSGTVFKITP